MLLYRSLLVAMTTVAIATGTAAAPALGTSGTPHHPAAGKQCTSTSTTGAKPSKYNRTPKGAGPWHVPLDPCNTEGAGAVATPYYNCAYWAAEKRPDVWVNAVWKYGYSTKHPGAWRIMVDARKAGYSINHHPKAGDLASWGRSAPMGSDAAGGSYRASAGGHIGYVERVLTHRRIRLSNMGVAGITGGQTITLTFNRKHTFFIHHG